MDIKDIPQDNSKIFRGQKKVIYATRNGNYESGTTSGWNDEEFATQQAVEELNQQTKQALQAVKNGEKSPLYYLMYKYRFDEQSLAQATGFWQWQIRRHCKPEVWAKLSQKKLEKYAGAFGENIFCLMGVNMTKFFDDNYDVIIQLNFSEDICFDDRENETDKRVCRFCGCEESEQYTFNKVAHAISNCLGNQSVITENECDICNSKFGKTIENELGKYVSYFKPLLKIQGKRGGSTFIQEGKGKKTEIAFDTRTGVEVRTNSDEHVSVDIENKQIDFKLKSSAYSPFAVYQAFMKIFLSTLPKEYVKEGDFVKLILNYETLDEYVSNIIEDVRNLELLRKNILNNAKAIKIFIPGYSLSDLMILKKKNIEKIGPGFIFVVRVANFAYQFSIPTLESSSSAEIPSIFSCFIENLPKEISEKIIHFIEDFSNIEKIAPEKKLSFSFSESKKLNQEEIDNY